MLFAFPVMGGIQDVSARVGRVTGHGVAGNLRRYYPTWLTYAIVFLMVMANVVNLGADIEAMGAALKLLLGGSALFLCRRLCASFSGAPNFGALYPVCIGTEMVNRDPLCLCPDGFTGKSSVGASAARYGATKNFLPNRLSDDVDRYLWHND